MTSLRKFIYAALLAVSALGLAPALASAQESHGQFTLTHSVLWEKAVVPPGEYVFSFKGDGAIGVLTLTKLDSPHAGFMFMVSDTDASKPDATSELVLQKLATGTYVSAMTLADDGVTLHFAAPRHSAEKIIARASNGTLAASR
jgi:hypothetical protein